MEFHIQIQLTLAFVKIYDPKILCLETAPERSWGAQKINLNSTETLPNGASKS